MVLIFGWSKLSILAPSKYDRSAKKANILKMEKVFTVLPTLPLLPSL